MAKLQYLTNEVNKVQYILDQLNLIQTFGSVSCEEAMHDVCAEVHTESNTDDEDVHAGDVDGEAPPVHEARHVQRGQQHAHHHQQRPAPAAQRHQGRHEDASWKKTVNIFPIATNIFPSKVVPKAMPMFLMSSMPTMASVSQLM